MMNVEVWRNMDNLSTQKWWFDCEQAVVPEVMNLISYIGFSCARHYVILGSGVTATLFLDFSNRSYVSCQLYTPAEIPQEDRDPHALNRTLCRHQRRSGRFAEEKRIFSLPGIKRRSFGYPARSQVTISTELSWRTESNINIL
jgi:hypothetical protein